MKNMLRTVGIALVVSLVTTVATVQILQRNRDILPSEQREEMMEQQVQRQTIREESAIVETVQNTDDAVVSVIIAKDLPVVERYFERGSPFEGFEFFFGDELPFQFNVPRYRQNGTERQEVGGGTAFFISDDGLLLTNKHVVDDEEAEYTVLLNDERKLKAEVVASDPGNDIAILKVEGEDFPALNLSTEEPKLGQTVIAIGNALGEFRNTVSVGVVSGLRRNVTAGTDVGGQVEQLESIIQTDAAINHGNSGGPLLSTQGEVIGMNTAIAAGAQNIGFAIPASDLRTALESYREHGKILKAFLGVRYMTITDELQEKNKLPYDYGALIVRGEGEGDLAIIPGSPADKAGLEENDIILEIDGEKLTTDHSLVRIIRHKAPGDTVRLKIYHDGKERDVTVELREQE